MYLSKIYTSRCILHSVHKNSVRNFRSQRYNQNAQPLNKKRKIGVLSTLAGCTLGGLLVYDGLANNFIYLKSFRRFMRSLNVATLISLDYTWHFLQYKNEHKEYDEKLKEVHLRSANRLLQACLLNGGLYIKIGQGVAAINHMIPKEYTQTLSKLEDQCLSSDPDDVNKIFAEDFGKMPNEIFAEFNYTPIAAASLAQVFKAKMKCGCDVAVKVQYYDLKQRFNGDIRTIIFLQDLIELFFKNYNFGWILKDIKEKLEQELDFVNEGKNGERCAKDLSNLKNIYVPKIFWNVTKDRVLTAEWIDGFKITNKEMIKKENINLYDVDIKLFSIFSEQIFHSGFVHADPHPGNILIRKNKFGTVELVLLDHGLYEVIPDHIRLPLCRFWEATVLKDEIAMRENSYKLNVENYKHLAEILFQSPVDLKSFSVKTKLTEKDIEYMQLVAQKHFDRIMQTLKEMPRNMLFVVRNLNTIRAISREHGDPVDRPKFMARYAQKCIYINGNIFLGYFKWLFRRIRFEYHLFRTKMRIAFLSTYLDILYKLGRSPEDSSIIEKLIPKEEDFQ